MIAFWFLCRSAKDFASASEKVWPHFAGTDIYMYM